MKLGMHTLEDFDYKGKTVLCRVDINEPIDRDNDRVKDETRIAACTETIKYLKEKGAKIVLLAHQGSDIEYKNFYTTRPHSKVLSKYLNTEVQFVDDVCGPTAREKIRNLNEGDVLLLDNVRFMSEEQTLFEQKLKLTHEQQTKTEVVKKLAPLADYYVCDAFAASHRDQPSLCGFEYVLPSAMGRLFEKEIENIDSVLSDSALPLIYVLGGAKVSDAFAVMKRILPDDRCTTVLTGGVVANIMLFANGTDIGEASLEFIRKTNYAHLIEEGKELLEKHRNKIVLPVDVAVVKDGKRIDKDVTVKSDEECVVDIGCKTINEYKKIIDSSKTIFINGPMGIFEEEQSELGTKEIWQHMANSSSFTLLGGGDSITAAEKYHLTDRFSFVSTGGGALIQYVSQKPLPVITALKKSKEIFG